MADQGAIEMHGEDDEDQTEGHHDGGRGDGGGDARRLGVIAGSDGQKLDPTQQNHLGQKEQSADDGGESPGQLDVAVHPLVGGLLHRVEVVDVADGLNVGQNAGADHQRKQVNSHQDRGAGAEGDQQSRRVRIRVVQLHLHHGHLQEPEVTLYNHHECWRSKIMRSRYHGKAGKQG